MTDNLRYITGKQAGIIDTTFRFPEKDGLLYAVEKCSGSGDCRKSLLIGGTMCPTFMVTHDEDKTTRGRANILREYLTRSQKNNPFDHEEIYRVMDLCLSCKACKSECPSNVDMTKFKAEFLSHYYREHGIPFRTRLIAWLPRLNVIGKAIRPVTNILINTALFKKIVGFETSRNTPSLSPTTLKGWAGRRGINENPRNRKVYLFADEFTDYNESDIGIKTIMLLEKLGYDVVIPKHRESGRTFLSKGVLNEARKVANENVKLLKDIITADSPLIGIEPSAILTFRDEYPEMVEPGLRVAALKLASNVLLLEEFICGEYDRGLITQDMFTTDHAKIKLHGHCQQKAIASTTATKRMLSLPFNYKVEEIPGGCCGMAGSFGYEKEHYELSMKIGEMVLFPAVRDSEKDTLIAASGTSCRHQIADGTGWKAFHPAEILYNAVIKG
jgi:Fe-S oxidoreductase